MTHEAEKNVADDQQMRFLLNLVEEDIERDGEMSSTMVRAGLLRDILRIAILKNEPEGAIKRTALYAKALFKMREMLTAVHDNLEDEGDRVYLGSSNQAELIHEAWHLADELKWDEILGDANAAGDQ